MQRLEITEIDIALVRRLAITWNLTEVGAPTVEPAAPYGSERLYDDLAPVLGLPEVEPPDEPDPADVEKALAAHGRLEHVFPVLLDGHGLAPGTYAVPDRAAFLDGTRRLSWGTVDVRREDDDLSDNGLVRFFQIFKSVWTARKAMERAEDAGVETVDVEVRAEHLALLERMLPRWEENVERATVVGGGETGDKLQGWIHEERLYPVPAFDPKRPYGECTYHYRDMAEALGMELEDGDDPSDAQVELLDRLHREMQSVVQAVCVHGKLEPGTYEPGEDGRFRRVS